MAWTLLAPYITSCPENNTHLAWQNFPALNITVSYTSNVDDTVLTDVQNNPNASVLTNETGPAITHNRSTPLSSPGMTVNLIWENPGLAVGPNGSYTTSTSAGEPKVRHHTHFLCTFADRHFSMSRGFRNSTPRSPTSPSWATTRAPPSSQAGRSSATARSRP